jgi:hypothetical protein
VTYYCIKLYSSKKNPGKYRNKKNHMSDSKENKSHQPELRDPGDIINEMTQRSVEEGRKIAENTDKFIHYRKPGTGERGHENPDKTWMMFVLFSY